MDHARPLVGRELELADIRAALERAADGHGGLVLLAGEPGIGKTRLADQASDEARAHGFQVVWGRCWEGEAPPAYLPWTQVLRALPVAPGGREPALAPLLPELGAAGVAPGEAAGFELLEAVMAELTAAAAARPLLLVLDDLHAADPGSLRLLEFVVRSLRGRRLLVLGSYRDVEARLSAESQPLLGRIAREGRTLTLGRLVRSETAALAEARLGRALPREIIEEVQRATEGNPLFVGETLALLAARGELERAAGAVVPIPSGVEDVIRGRLARLSAAARRALQIASVLGRDLDIRVAAELISSHGVGGAEAALAEAESLGFVSRAEPGRLRLSHALVRDAIYASLPAGERRVLHLGASRLFEAAGGGEDPAFEAAHHALLALPDGGTARAVALATAAAEGLAQRLAFEAAAEMYGRALQALPVVPPDPLGRCDLLIALARSLISSGAVADARSRALEAAALARAADDGRRLASAALAFGAEIRISIVDPTLVGLLEEALAALPVEDASIRPLVMARLAAARQPADDPDPPVALAREAIALARATGNPELVLRTLHAALGAMVDYAPPAERLPLARELAAAATARHDRALALQSRMRAFIDHLELGNVSGADAELARVEALAREIGHPRYLWRPLLARAMRAAMIGRFDEAEHLRAEAHTLATQTDDPNFPLVYAMQAFGIALERGREAEIREAGQRIADMAQGLSGESVWRPVFTALAGVRAGALDEARAEWTRLPATQPLLSRDSLLIVMAGEVAAALGDTRRAAEIERHLAPRTGHHATYGQMGLTWLGPVRRVLGLLAAARGAYDEAANELGRAAAEARAVGAAPFVARVEAELAAVEGKRTHNRTAAPLEESGAPLTMAAEGDVWVLSRAGRTLRLRASRGLAMLARLVAEPGRELHVLDLAGASGVAIDGGDAGPLLDAQARDAYRTRYEDLEHAIADAESIGDRARAEKARSEREALADELARGVGLRGRDRRAGAASERARVNVQRRLKDAVDRVADADPELGRHLERSLRTGSFCRYQP